jgi:hypothetical protein
MGVVETAFASVMRNKALGFVLAKLVGSPADAQIFPGRMTRLPNKNPARGLRPG